VEILTPPPWNPGPQTKTASSRGPAQTERLHTDRRFFIRGCRCTALPLWACGIVVCAARSRAIVVCSRLAGIVWITRPRRPKNPDKQNNEQWMDRECTKWLQCVITSITWCCDKRGASSVLWWPEPCSCLGMFWLIMPSSGSVAVDFATEISLCIFVIRATLGSFSKGTHVFDFRCSKLRYQWLRKCVVWFISL
jgi:hypothetical protein